MMPVSWNNPLVEVVDRAVLLPGSKWSLRDYDGAVFDEKGRVVYRAQQMRQDRLLGEPVWYESNEEVALEGTHMYGGRLFQHFGHGLMDSIGRLWALKIARGAVESLVFLPGFIREPAIPKWFGELMELLEIRCEIQVAVEPFRVEQLIVPDQLFGQGDLIVGHPLLFDFLERAGRTARKEYGDRAYPDRVYVSRSRLPAGKGSIGCESVLEANMVRNGFEILHPQVMSLSEQIMIYQNAKVLVFAEGSALHMFGLYHGTNQTVGVVCRRYNGVAEFLRQIRSRGRCSPHALRAVRRMYLPVDVRIKWPNARGMAELDFERLRDQMTEYGILPENPYWKLPSDESLDSDVKRFKQAFPEVRVE